MYGVLERQFRYFEEAERRKGNTVRTC